VVEFHDSEWARKGATLSDKTARSEYGLTQDKIFAAIDAGKLQYRPPQSTETRGSGCSAARSKISPGPCTVNGSCENSRRGPNWHGSTVS
jgi:hypothetical protein